MLMMQSDSCYVRSLVVEKLYENRANHLRQKVVEQSNLQNELLACSYVLVHVNLVATNITRLYLPCFVGLLGSSLNGDLR